MDPVTMLLASKGGGDALKKAKESDEQQKKLSSDQMAKIMDDLAKAKNKAGSL